MDEVEEKEEEVEEEEEDHCLFRVTDVPFVRSFGRSVTSTSDCSNGDKRRRRRTTSTDTSARVYSVTPWGGLDLTQLPGLIDCLFSSYFQSTLNSKHTHTHAVASHFDDKKKDSRNTKSNKEKLKIGRTDGQTGAIVEPSLIIQKEHTRAHRGTC